MFGKVRGGFEWEIEREASFINEDGANWDDDTSIVDNDCLVAPLLEKVNGVDSAEFVDDVAK